MTGAQIAATVRQEIAAQRPQIEAAVSAMAQKMDRYMAAEDRRAEVAERQRIAEAEVAEEQRVENTFNAMGTMIAEAFDITPNPDHKPTPDPGDEKPFGTMMAEGMMGLVTERREAFGDTDGTSGFVAEGDGEIIEVAESLTGDVAFGAATFTG